MTSKRTDLEIACDVSLRGHTVLDRQVCRAVEALTGEPDLAECVECNAKRPRSAWTQPDLRDS